MLRSWRSRWAESAHRARGARQWWRAERESRPPAPFCRRRASLENRLTKSISSGQRESHPHSQLGGLWSFYWTMSANGGTGETRTRINRVQAGYSPLELRSRGARRNRTFSPGFGGPAGHHDSATHEGLATKRPVAGFEPLSLHRRWSCDASCITRHKRRKNVFRVADGESNPPPQGHGLPSSQTSTATMFFTSWVVVGSHQVLPVFSRALSLD